MPIKLPDDFPAATLLWQEGIVSLTPERADHQDIRPLKVVLFNLMPTKIDTEVQLLRLISNSSIQIEATFLRSSTHQTKYGASHLDRFYADFDSIKQNRYDAIIITGAPVEQLAFEDVDYWNEMSEIVRWAKRNVFAKLYICWGAQAGMYVNYGTRKVEYDRKLFGIFKHDLIEDTKLTRGFDDVIHIPQSRYTGVDEEALKSLVKQGTLKSIVGSSECGDNILATPDFRDVYIFGHLEYDRDTLDTEYHRDLKRGLEINPPVNYYYDEENLANPRHNWKAHANLFFDNWIDFVYQETPYNLTELMLMRTVSNT